MGSKKCRDPGFRLGLRLRRLDHGYDLPSSCGRCVLDEAMRVSCMQGNLSVTRTARETKRAVEGGAGAQCSARVGWVALLLGRNGQVDKRQSARLMDVRDARG